MRGLKGEADSNRNGFVTVGELFEYVRESVKNATNHKQHPSIGTNPFDRNLPLAITNLGTEGQPLNLMTSSSLLLLNQGKANPNTKIRLVLFTLATTIAGCAVLILINRWHEHFLADPGAVIPSSSSPSISPPISADIFEKALALEQATITQMPKDGLTEDALEQVIENWQNAIRLMKQIVPTNENYLQASQKLSEYENQLRYVEALRVGIIAAKLTQAGKDNTLSLEEWENIKRLWQQAMTKLNEVPSTDSNYAKARRKMEEYQNNESYASQASSLAPYIQGIRKAENAGRSATTAKSQEDWLEIAGLWDQASGLMRKVSSQSVYYETAKKKSSEYQSKRTYAQRQAVKLVSGES